MTEYFLTRPFPQPELNQLFWGGVVLFAGIMLSMIHLFIHKDQQTCAENLRHEQHDTTFVKRGAAHIHRRAERQHEAGY